MTQLKIELDLNCIKSLQLTPNEYVALYCRQKNVFKEYQSLTALERAHLESLGYIKITDVSSNTILSNPISLYNTGIVAEHTINTAALAYDMVRFKLTFFFQIALS